MNFSRRDEYDVCIIGSGAGGGMAAYALTRAGARVVVLEAGGSWDNMSSDSAMLRWPYDTPRRGAGTTDRPFGEFDACIGGRAACHYCGQCNRGRAVNANLSSTNVLLAPAMETGRLTMVTHAMAREVTLDAQGRASGVNYIDTVSGADGNVRARVVVLAASALESARLLLSSKSSKFPGGLANSSGRITAPLPETAAPSRTPSPSSSSTRSRRS